MWGMTFELSFKKIFTTRQYTNELRGHARYVTVIGCLRLAGHGKDSLSNYLPPFPGERLKEKDKRFFKKFVAFLLRN